MIYLNRDLNEIGGQRTSAQHFCCEREMKVKLNVAE